MEFLKLYFYFSFIFGALISIFAGGIALYQNRKRVTNIIWASLNFLSPFWSLGYFTMIITTDKNIAWIGSWVSHGAAIFIPVLYFHFIVSLLKKFKTYKYYVFLSYAIGFVLLFFVPTKLFIHDLAPRFVFNFAPLAGPVFIIYFVHFWLNGIIGAIILFKEYLKSTGILAQQYKYLLIGAIGLLGGGSTFFFTFNIDIAPYPVILYTIYPVIMTYAILRYRFMDIRGVILRSLSFATIVLLVMVFFAGLSATLGAYLQQIVGFKSDLLIGLIVGLFVTLSYKSVIRITESATRKFLYRKSYNPDILLKNISNASSSILELQPLLKSLTEILYAALEFEKSSFVFITSEGRLKVASEIGFRPGDIGRLISHPDIATILSKQLERFPGIQVIDEIYTKYINGEYEPLDENLLKILNESNIALIIPLYAKGFLSGLLVLGVKKSGDPYNIVDLRTLEIISGQVAVAIENARLYDELRYFNVKLGEEVKEKTKQLRKANVDLKKLDVAKSEFISIASHQLRTPLTVIKGYISMMQEGSFGPVRPKILANLDKVYVSNERLITLVENLLDISRIESGRQEFAWKKVQLEDLAAEVTEKLQESAAKKKLKLTYHKPKQKLPAVVVDDGRLHEVMMNFVDNAVKYTAEGKVDVYMTQEKDMLTFCVKDTGKGMSEDGKNKLFKKFSRGKDSFKQHTEGLGLGLYVATMMMKAHEGKIWAESEGEGKGSSFCFSVPIKNKHKDGETSKIDEKVVEEARAQEKKETMK